MFACVHYGVFINKLFFLLSARLLFSAAVLVCLPLSERERERERESEREQEQERASKRERESECETDRKKTGFSEDTPFFHFITKSGIFFLVGDGRKKKLREKSAREREKGREKEERAKQGRHIWM